MTKGKIGGFADFPDEPVHIRHGHRWGLWMLDAQRFCLCAVPEDVSDPQQNFYEIDLEEITHPFWLVDWLEQISEKAWATPEVLGQLTLALLRLFTPRSTEWRNRAPAIIDPAAVLRRNIEVSR